MTTTAPPAIDQQTLVTVLTAAVEVGVVPLLWGDPGIGKSAIVRAVAAHQRVHLETVIGALRDPTDIGGLPVVTDGGVRLEAPAWAKRLHAAATAEPDEDAPLRAGGLLFLDELSTSAPATQAAMLSVALDRMVGELQLPHNVAIIAAANPPENAAGGWDLAAPLANRLMHLHLTADPAAWVAGMVTGFPLPAPRTVGVRSRVRSAAARAEVAGFIRTRPALLHDLPADATGTGQAWPSPRTWSMAADMLSVLPRQDEDACLAAASGLVGEGAATELLTWRRSEDLPDPATVLADPAAIAWAALAPDRVWALLSGVVSHCIGQRTVKAWREAWEPLRAAAEAGCADVAAANVRLLLTARPDGAGIPSSAKAFAAAATASGMGTRAAA